MFILCSDSLTDTLSPLASPKTPSQNAAMKIDCANASFDDQHRDPEHCASSAAGCEGFDTTTAGGHVVSHLVRSFAESESARVSELALAGPSVVRAQLQVGHSTFYRALFVQGTEKGRAA